MKVNLQTLLFIVFSMVLASTSHAQQDDTESFIDPDTVTSNTIVIAFDENGQMIQFPPQVINRKQTVVFKVRVSKSSFAEQVNHLFTRIDSTYSYFTKSPDNQFYLWSLFGTDPDMIQKWLAELDSFGVYRNRFSLSTLYDLREYAKEGGNPYNEAKQFESLPLRLFLKQLLYKRFVIRTFNGNLVLNRTIRLRPALPKLVAGGDDCYWWYSNKILLDTLLGSNCSDCSNNIRFSLVKTDPLQATVTEWYNKWIEETCADPDGKDSLVSRLNYLLKESVVLANIKEKDTLSKTVTTWIKGIVDTVRERTRKKNNELRPVLKLGDRLTQEKKLLIGDLLGPFKVNEAVSARLTDSVITPALLTAIENMVIESITKQVVDGIKITQFMPGEGKPPIDKEKYLQTLRQVRCWLFKWLWYNNGWLVINPLPLKQAPKDDVKETLEKQIKDSTRLLQTLQQQRDFLDSARVHVKPVLNNLDTLRKVQDSATIVYRRIDHIQKSIDSLNKLLKEDAKAREAAVAAKAQAGITSMQAYAGLLPILGYTEWYRQRWLLPGKLTVMQQFNYSASKKSISLIYRNEWQKARRSEIPENERALMVIHNIPVKSTINVTHALTGYNDTEEFTILFQKLMKGLDSTGLLQLALAGPLTNFSSFLTSTFRRNDKVGIMEQTAKAAGLAQSGTGQIDPKTFSYLVESAKNSPVVLTSHMSTLPTIGYKTDTTVGYISSFILLPDSTAPYMVNSTIQIDSVKAKSSLRVGALHRMQLAAGFALVRNPVQQVSIDTVGNGFKTGSSGNNSSAILGVKLYPFRSYLRDGNIWPRYPLRRLSVMFAVAVPKPLDNFYLGGGYDIVPGLTYTMGMNIYRQNYYQIQNAAIIKSSTRYTNGGVYYGVTVNPVIFVQFVKLFFN